MGRGISGKPAHTQTTDIECRERGWNMGLFQPRDTEYTRTFHSQNEDSLQEENREEEPTWDEDYDDGFDDLEPEEEPELSPEEQRGIRKRRIRVMYDMGNTVGVVAGVVVILLLITLLISMVNFVLNDMDRNLSLFQTRF